MTLCKKLGLYEPLKNAVKLAGQELIETEKIFSLSKTKKLNLEDGYFVGFTFMAHDIEIVLRVPKQVVSSIMSFPDEAAATRLGFK